MNDIEELVRESLRSAPPVNPSVSDPTSVVAARVRRVQAWCGGVVAVVLIAVVAVVVPLSVRDSGANRLVPGTESPAPAAARHGLTVWSHDAVAVTAGGGYLYALERAPNVNDGSGFVVKGA